MSRIGKRPIALPEGVNATLEGTSLTMKGKKDSLSRSFADLKRITLKVEGKTLTVNRNEETGEARREQGLARALIQNMAQGLGSGFSRVLDMVGVGYRAEVKGKDLNLSLGFSHPVLFPIPEGVSIAVEKQTRLAISGASRELVGETAARIRKIRPPEPYKGKGVRYADEVVRRKAGKTAAKAGA